MLKSRIGIRMHCALLGVLLAPASVCGQNTNSSNQELVNQLAEQIKQLQQEDYELQARIEALEGRKLQTQAGTQPAVQITLPQSAGESAPALPPPTFDWHDVHGMQWRGFGEVNYKVLDQRTPELGTEGFVPGSTGNFYTGDFDLFLSAKLSDKTSVLSEISFAELDHQTFNVDLERFLLQYEFNDSLKVSVGRYQTGISYYNTAFRGAKFLLTTADRPLIMQFADEGGLLPTQAVGVSVTGRVPSGRLGLNYLSEYGSSDTVRPDINGSGKIDDENNGNHINVGLFIRPEILPGLQIGGSFYHDKISDLSLPSSVRIGQSIVNAHVIYVAEGFEILNEGFLIRHAPGNPAHLPGDFGPFNMPAFYSQFSKCFGHIRPFFRYQYVNMNKETNIFDDVGLRYGPSFGARYDFNESVAFKAQLDHTVRKAQPDLNGLQMQVVFAF